MVASTAYYQFEYDYTDIIITPGTTWGTSGPTYYGCYPESDYRTVCRELLTALAKKRKREVRAVGDRQILRGIAHLQSLRAHETIRERRRFTIERKHLAAVRGRRRNNT